MRKICVAILLCGTISLVSAQDIKDALPTMNICVYNDEPTMGYINCLIEKIQKDIVERTLEAVRELFPDSTLLETLRYVCKANNDEGWIIMDAVVDNISEEDLKKCMPIVWECHDLYLI